MTAGVVASAEENAPSSNTCESIVREQRIAQAFGSVGLMAKMRNSAASIRAVARNLLAQALEHPSTRFDAYPTACGEASAMVVYKVAPTTFLPDSGQRDICMRLEAETSEKPLTFLNRQFVDLDDSNEWIMKFSRGKGADDKSLFARCGANCSPRYTKSIESGYSVTPEVVCGQAPEQAISAVYGSAITLPNQDQRIRI